MAEPGNQGKDLVRVRSHAIVSIDAREPLDLATARVVLATVVRTHENTLTEASNLTKVGIYDIDQVREALNLVSRDIMSGISWVEKQTQSGRLMLFVYHLSGEDSKTEEPESLYMSLTNAGGFVLESEVPLRQSDSWVRQDAVRFSDFRRGVNVVSMYDIKKKFSIDSFRHIWRGMRWLSANMLDWSGDFKLPEDLEDY